MLGEIAFALGMVALVFLPGICFVALFRLIDYVAHDGLVARFRRGDVGARSPARPTATALDPANALAATRDRETVGCAACGTENRDGVDYCRNCLSSLD